MPAPRPYLLTVYDPTEGRLLRLQELPDEETLKVRELEERDRYARHPHVEVQGHWGRGADEVRAEYEQRSRKAVTLTPEGPMPRAATGLRPPL